MRNINKGAQERGYEPPLKKRTPQFPTTSMQMSAASGKGEGFNDTYLIHRRCLGRLGEKVDEAATTTQNSSLAPLDGAD